MSTRIPIDISMGFFNSRIARPGMQKTIEHTINEYQLEFCDTDGGVTYIDGIAYPIRKSMIICAKPGQRRWTRLPFCCYYIKIPRDDHALSPILQSMKDSWVTAPELMESFLQAFHRLTEGSDMSEMRYYNSILTLVADVAEDSFRSDDRSTAMLDSATQAESAVESAKKYIDTHFGEKCSLETVAKHAGFSPIYFHRLFKGCMGMSPNEYLLCRRLSEAKERLASSDMTLSEIAEQCGFGSQSYFQYVFRRETGMTPTAYRKQQHQKYLAE